MHQNWLAVAIPHKKVRLWRSHHQLLGLGEDGEILVEAALHRNSKRKGPKIGWWKGLKKGIFGDLLVVGSDDLFFLHIFFVFNRVFWNMCFETTNSSVHFGLVQKGAHLCGHTEGPVARQVICRTAGDSVEATTSRHDVTGMMVTRGNYTTMASVTLSSSYLVRSLQYFHKKWGLRLLTPFIQHAIYYHFNIHIYIY